MRLLLIRHGQTPANLDHVLDTAEPGSALTGEGLRQAAALPDALAGEDIGALLASTLLRARQTAAPLARALGVEPLVRRELRELEAGVWEGRRDADAVRSYMSTAVAWGAGHTGVPMPGAEGGAAFLARYDAAVAEAAALGARTVAIVAHGTAFRVWTAARARNVSVEFATAHALPNTGVVTLEGSPEEGWTARSWTGTALGRDAPAAVSG
ncbi:histidine phosphatase family protein [Streptomyces sp. NPDC004126]|uniref:histidine phosphatase family protein n=1 Tax=Streptomyces sp. NPDC004126 TaxID=3390695 RepID=UPI003D03C2C5